MCRIRVFARFSSRAEIRVEESSEASAESATGTETTVIPAAEPQQTEPKPAEPKPAEPAPAPKTQENTTTPSE